MMQGCAGQPQDSVCADQPAQQLLLVQASFARGADVPEFAALKIYCMPVLLLLQILLVLTPPLRKDPISAKAQLLVHQDFDPTYRLTTLKKFNS